MRTVTFDPDLYKLVPCNLTDDMRDGWDLSPNDEDIDVEMRNGYRGMLAAVPDQLPGVVEHTGEPVAWDEAQRVCDLPDVDEVIRGFLTDPTGDNATCMVRGILKHATPSQPRPSVLFESPFPNIKGRTDKDVLLMCDQFLEDMHTQPIEETISVSVWLANEVQHALNESQPSAEALVQAALDAVINICAEYEEIATAVKDSALLVGKVDLSNAMSGDPRAARFIADRIRALDKQQIIESCKEKS